MHDGLVGDHHIINLLADTHTRGGNGDLLIVSHTIGGGKCNNLAVNPGTVAISQQSVAGRSDVGGREDSMAGSTQTDVMIVGEFLCEMFSPTDTINDASCAAIHDYMHGSLNL